MIIKKILNFLLHYKNHYFFHSAVSVTEILQLTGIVKKKFF